MGIILVNTAEDYQEDREAGVKTVIVTLGLARGIRLSSVLTVVGATGMLATLGVLFWMRGVTPLQSAALLPALGAYLWMTTAIYRLSRRVAAAPLEDGVALVKHAAKNVPAWVTVVAWTSLAAVLILFLSSRTS